MSQLIEGLSHTIKSVEILSNPITQIKLSPFPKKCQASSCHMIQRLAILKVWNWSTASCPWQGAEGTYQVHSAWWDGFCPGIVPTNDEACYRYGEPLQPPQEACDDWATRWNWYQRCSRVLWKEEFVVWKSRGKGWGNVQQPLCLQQSPRR